MAGYRNVLFSTDGDGWVFDNEANTINEVWNLCNEMGSRWIFYPLPFVVKNVKNQDFKFSKIIDTCDGLEFLKGKTVNTARRWIKENQEEVYYMLQ